jgi:antitoxin ParD1/3/4
MATTMNISLTPELEKFVEARVQSGYFQTTSEVIRAGLRLLVEQEQLRELRMEELRKTIRVGLDQLDRGEGIPAEEAHTELDRRRAARAVSR